MGRITLSLAVMDSPCHWFSVAAIKPAVNLVYDLVQSLCTSIATQPYFRLSIMNINEQNGVNLHEY